MDYQKTVNLPQTNFSMKAGLVEKEPAMLKQWEKQNLYALIRAKSKGKKTFILHDGPPYANGNIHIGHVLNKTLKDIIVKMKTMQGYDSHYIPGWDCHGLPIEHQLLKELKKNKSEVEPLDFRKKAHQYAMKYVDIQREEFKRLGVLGDWDKPYLTLTTEYEYWILKSFAELTKKGYIYRGLKPVNWCYQCETALAEAEVEYEDHTSPSIYVKFKVENPQVIKGLPAGKKVYLLIWTTTPWTLLANVAVAVHPSYKYKFVDDPEHGILVMEDSLVPTGKWREKGGHPPILLHVKGQMLEDVKYAHPFDRDNCCVVMADYVTKEEGTGLVHIAPGHGQDDFQTGLKYNLPVFMPVNDRGVYTKEAGKYEGERVFKANPKIIDDLQEKGLLFKADQTTHSYPHCWRCKKPIIFRATKQWFLKIDHKGLRENLKKIIQNNVRWIPSGGQERILSMVTLRPDWCLSRQRHWGVPIPALACKGCGGEHKLFPEVIEYFAQMVRKQGTDIWFLREVEELIPEGFVCPDCKKDDFKKTFDILDVWFDSGVSHQAVVKAMMKKELPIDMYLEGSDQHRGWFQSSLIPAVALEGRPPFSSVLTHGFVVDGQGRKMSKSLGNVIAPQDVMKTNGADILRLWVASSIYNDDIRVSKEILERLVDAYRKIRNTIRFLLGNLYDYDPDHDEVSYGQLLDIDQWALERLATTVNAIKESYNNYDFAQVYKLIYSFCNEDLSSFYLDILKDRLYTFASTSLERRASQTVLYHILNYLVCLMAPILTFTADEVFGAMPKTSKIKNIVNVHLLEWLEPPATWQNTAINEKFKLLFELRPFVLKAIEEKRRAEQVGSSLETKVIFKTASGRDFDYLMKLKEDLPAAFIVSQVEIQHANHIAHGVSEHFSKTAVQIEKADGEKCPRCWNYRVLGEDREHPALCGRCAQTVREILNRTSRP